MLMSQKTYPTKKNFWTALSVGWFLAYRDIKGAHIGTTLLIGFVMTLTFLNLIVVSGILVGLTQGSVNANKRYYGGDLIISPYSNEGYVKESQRIIKLLQATPGFKEYTARYGTGVQVTSNYKSTLAPGEVYNTTGAFAVGIDPVKEDMVTGISAKLLEGDFLKPDDTDSVVVGANILFKYSPIETPSQQTLKNVEVGKRVLVKIGENKKEFLVKGVVKTKVNDVDLRVFMTEDAFRKLAGREDLNVYEIIVRLDDAVTAQQFKELLIASGAGELARVRTSSEAEPKFLKDIQATFGMLGNIIGSIGLVVASITIFIVIFINAITRRRFIGILKGVGISGTAIIFSYILQALFYALIGVVLGSLITFGLLKPLFDANPINFPFSDGILVATAGGALTRSLVLLIATTIAGYIPAHIIIRQNTLDAILGR